MRSCEARRTAEAPRREDPRIANTGGGIVVIGVEDGSKNVRGVPDVLAAEEKLANLVSDSIRPRLIPDIDAVSADCFFSARTGSPGSRMPGSRRGALPERIEHVYWIQQRSARSCLALPKMRLHFHIST
jgi:hypothetical protein